MYLFFDTETTGLSGTSDRIVQIAWVLTDAVGNVLAEESHIIKPVGFSIPSGATAIHGITTERAIRDGRPAREVLLALEKNAPSTRCLVAHNMTFDLKFLRMEYENIQRTFPFPSTPMFCTMKQTTALCALPKLSGAPGAKWPKLQELHWHLFHRHFDGDHDALADAKACMRCFFELKRQELIVAPLKTINWGSDDSKTAVSTRSADFELKHQSLLAENAALKEELARRKKTIEAISQPDDHLTRSVIEKVSLNNREKAGLENCPLDVQKQLLRDPDPEVRFILAKNPCIAAETALRIWASDENTAVRHEITKNKYFGLRPFGEIRSDWLERDVLALAKLCEEALKGKFEIQEQERQNRLEEEEEQRLYAEEKGAYLQCLAELLDLVRNPKSTSKSILKALESPAWEVNPDAEDDLNDFSDECLSQFMVAAAKHPKANSQLLERCLDKAIEASDLKDEYLADEESNDYYPILVAVAQNQKCPPSCLTRLYDLVDIADEQTSSLALAIAGNSSAHESALAGLVIYNHSDSEVAVAARNNPNYSAKAALPLWKDLASNPYWDDRESVAKNTDCPEVIQLQLAKDVDYRVRIALTENPNLSPKTLRALLRDKDEDVRNYALDRKDRDGRESNLPEQTEKSIKPF
jgi:DNA polymerase-3 subunit epsilon